ncbi:Cupin domain protein [Rosistilla carotiformis]|uniref:Cupin domain protein n=1 Tax=Rosistilla carotiformis TaxID=2528017 RepID=A0A518JYT6_9BACT|nr:cupin domain-containing protein [Rosistilla carotiformis]QDV70703.1 Cupin domain protein [Rosistilla carotiformis]
MTIPHAKSGEIIAVGPLGSELPTAKTHALLKSDAMELLRMVLPAGKKIAEHKAPGEITVHCLEGKVEFTAMGKTHELTSGRLLHLPAAEPHALQAVEDSSLLVTILRRPADA